MTAREAKVWECVVRLSLLNFQVRNASQLSVHKICKNPDPQALEIPACQY